MTKFGFHTTLFWIFSKHEALSWCFSLHFILSSVPPICRFIYLLYPGWFCIPNNGNLITLKHCSSFIGFKVKLNPATLCSRKLAHLFILGRREKRGKRKEKFINYHGFIKQGMNWRSEDLIGWGQFDIAWDVYLSSQKDSQSPRDMFTPWTAHFHIPTGFWNCGLPHDLMQKRHLTSLSSHKLCLFDGSRYESQGFGCTWSHLLWDQHCFLFIN